MGTDIKTDITPSISEKTQSKSPSVEQILSDVDNRPAIETFKQLASHEIPQDNQPENNQPLITTETPIETQPSISDTTARDQAEIAQIKQNIQNLLKRTLPQSTEVTPEAPLPQLFPNLHGPSLYEQHHQEYETEIQTSEGAIQRENDIKTLQQEGYKNSEEIYDGLRSRGVTRQNLIADINNKQLYFASKIQPDKLLKAIDRLYIVSLLDLNSFSPENYRSTYTNLASELKQNQKTDAEFKALCEYLNPYTFLQNSKYIENVIFQKTVQDLNIAYNPENDNETTNSDTLLEKIKKTFFSNPNQESIFNQYKSRLSQYEKDRMFDFLTNSDIENSQLFLRALTQVGIISDETKTAQLKELNPKDSWINTFFKLNDQQRQLLINNFDISVFRELDKIIPDELITSTDSKDQKLIASILSIKSLDSSVTYHLKGKNIKDFLNQQGNLTSQFFETITKEGLFKSKFFTTNFTPEIITTFSPEDQKFWNFLMSKNLSVEKNKKVISNDLVALIITNKEQLASTITDIDFLNTLVGRFGKKSETIIKKYLESLTSKVITKEDKTLVLEFLNEFSVLTPNIINDYKEAKQNHTEKLFISSLKEIAQKLTSSKGLSEIEYQSPYYQDLIQHVYPNNVGQYTSYESNHSCSDRSSDLSQFNIKDVYQIDLLSQSEIKIKDGEQVNPNLQIQLEKPILQVLENLRIINFDKELANQQLHQQADKILTQINLPDIDLSRLSIEDKLFIITSESIYHHQNIDSNDLKHLLITYEFVNFEDIRNFIQGTNDKVSQSNNPDYAHLCELSNFYSDRIKEVNKRIIESVSANPQISQLLPTYFKSLTQQESQQSTQNNLNKLQTDKLGLADGFVDQLAKTLKRRFPDKIFTSDQVKRMLHIYETVTQGLTEQKSNSPDKNTQAFYGQLRSQREKTFALLKQLGSDYIDPRSIHLDEINLQQALNLNQSIESGNYNQDEFLAYTAQKFINIFVDEKSQLDTELSKYVSENGTQREVLNAYITKTKSSANARMVGGVCVSGDNPIDTSGIKQKLNQWDMSNYFQMVFQDPENYQCRGLCLLHHFKENGKKVLTVSFNPSSTYLYSVDESSIFNGIYDHLKDFASQNGFDIIATSQNKAIRTNRRGGIFEQSIDKKVSQIHKIFSFSKEKQFSYYPEYKIKDMDVIWERQ